MFMRGALSALRSGSWIGIFCANTWGIRIAYTEKGSSSPSSNESKEI